MSLRLLMREKDKFTTKYQLALFTSDESDNLELAARIAHLEAEAAGVAITAGDSLTAFPCLIAAAAAHRTLGEKVKALSCLDRARLLGAAGDSANLLAQAIGDLRKSIQEAAAAAQPSKAAAPPSPPAVKTVVAPPPPPTVVEEPKEEPKEEVAPPPPVETSAEPAEPAEPVEKKVTKKSGRRKKRAP